MSVDARGGAVLRFAATADEARAGLAGRDDDDASGTAAAGPADRRPDAWLILDPAWTPTDADVTGGLIPLREVAARVLAREDLFPTTTRLLDDWAEASGIVAGLTIGGTSFWYRRRLWAWRWLHERLIWIGILDDIARGQALAAIELPGVGEPALREVAILVARRGDLELLGPGAAEPGAAQAGDPFETDDTEREVGDPGTPAEAPRRRAGNPITDLLRGLVRSTRLRPVDRRRERIARRRAALDRRLDALATGRGGRLLVIADPAVYQEVATATGSRSIDPFLGPVVERLAGSSLAPIVVELGSRAGDDATWTRVTSEMGNGTIPGDTVDRRFADPSDDAESVRTSAAVAVAVAGCQAPLEFAGVDLGPALLRGIVRYVDDALAARLREVARAKRLVAAVRPAALLMVDEYGRTEWLAAARQLGVPVAAVQHGIIHAWHPGYQHRDRPAARPIPQRTYCFGDFERRLLIETGGYRPDEIVVSGSPRLDLVGERPSAAELADVRAGLGVGAKSKLLLVSTTFASVYRRFYTPVVLAALLGEPLRGVHVVIKLHPGESDGELYRRLLSGLVSAGPRSDLTIVKRMDLYQLLAAADAHLGIYSTVLTEAVVTGTPNLIAATQAASDLLGYVDAGVAIPVSTGADVQAALDVAGSAVSEEQRRAFLDDHFRPGSAADRIAADLTTWVSGSA